MEIDRWRQDRKEGKGWAGVGAVLSQGDPYRACDQCAWVRMGVHVCTGMCHAGAGAVDMFTALPSI